MGDRTFLRMVFACWMSLARSSSSGDFLQGVNQLKKESQVIPQILQNFRELHKTQLLENSKVFPRKKYVIFGVVMNEGGHSGKRVLARLGGKE